jgi:hypothetical protein
LTSDRYIDFAVNAASGFAPPQRNTIMLRFRKLFSMPFAALVLLLAVVSTTLFTGCQRKERVVDIRTPAGDVHVDRDTNTGDVEVNVHDNKP